MVAQESNFLRSGPSLMANATLKELAHLFLKLGTFGFGGPAVHIATMEEEVVQRKGWLSEQEFLDLVGATNLIPGPNSTELAIHIGYRQAGWPGLLVAGSCFILPAILITGLFAALYVEYGDLPQTTGLMAGIQPAVLAVILGAGWRLGKKALVSRPLQAIAVTVAVISFLLPGQAILILVISSLVGTLLLRSRDPQNPQLPKKEADSSSKPPKASPAMLISASTVATTAAASGNAGAASMLMLGWIFLKVGAVLYGSGYVLIAYLEGELVHQREWLTQGELLDAIAIGQFTPGPILSTATFIGYVVMATATGKHDWQAGIEGALMATFAIFLPAFLLVAITSRWVRKLRSHRTLSRFLDAVNAASMGLMATVLLRLAVPALYPMEASADLNIPLSVACRLLIAGLATLLLFGYRVSPIKIISGGLLLGALLGTWLV